MNDQSDEVVDRNQTILSAFDSLWTDVPQATFPTKRPLLAHYTSIEALESIIRTNQLWFSNPLCMNDLQELRFGMLEGARAFRNHEQIEKACGTQQRHALLLDIFDRYFSQFENEHAFDTYVFCLSEHDPDNHDGLLSMWRGYGGNGKGAAIVFDAEQLNEVEGSPLILANVTYASHDDRIKWINGKMDECAEIMRKLNLADNELYVAAFSVFERLKIFSIFTKHCGFAEEREWRVAYMHDRDTDKKLHHMLDYGIGQRGIEPKLKFNVEPVEGLTASDLSLEKIVCQIILGPSLSSPLSAASVRRMLERQGKAAFSAKLTASTTPLRPI